MSGTLDQVLAAADVVSVLTRDIRVRLANISRSGCLVQSDCRMEVGTVGVLRLSRDGLECRDEVRIVRAQEVRGASACWHLGVEFLWTSQPGAWSLRRMAARLQAGGGPLLAAFEVADSRCM